MNWMRLLGFSLMIGSLVLVGCGESSSGPKATKEKLKADDDEEHGHGEGPHGGTIFDLGKYHAEFTVDHDKKEATVYIYDGPVKKLVPIAAESLTLSIKSPNFQTELKAVPSEGDPKGKSSRFVGTHESLGKVQEFEGSVSGKIDEKQYVGDFKEEPHDPDSSKKK